LSWVPLSCVRFLFSDTPTPKITKGWPFFFFAFPALPSCHICHSQAFCRLSPCVFFFLFLEIFSLAFDLPFFSDARTSPLFSARCLICGESGFASRPDGSCHPFFVDFFPPLQLETCVLLLALGPFVTSRSPFWSPPPFFFYPLEASQAFTFLFFLHLLKPGRFLFFFPPFFFLFLEVSGIGFFFLFGHGFLWPFCDSFFFSHFSWSADDP